MGESNPKSNRETDSQTQASESLKDSQHTNHHFDAVKINPNETNNLLKRGEGGREFERGGKQTSPFMCPPSLIEKNLQAKNQTQDSQNFDAVKIDKNQSPTTQGVLGERGSLGGRGDDFAIQVPLPTQEEKSFANQILESQKDSQAKNQIQDSCKTSKSPQQAKSSTEQISESPKDSLFTESTDSLISISKGITMSPTSQKGQEMKKTSKSTNIQVKSAKAPKLYRPLIASALATALGVSVAVADSSFAGVRAFPTVPTPPTVSCGAGGVSFCTNIKKDDQFPTLGVTWQGADLSTPSYTSQGGSATTIEDLNLNFTSNGTSNITGSGNGNAYTVTLDSGTVKQPDGNWAPANREFFFKGNGKGIQIGANGAGNMNINFGGTVNEFRTLTLDLSDTAGTTSFKGNIKIDNLHQATLNAFFGKNVEGNITVHQWGNTGSFDSNVANFVFLNGANLTGNININRRKTNFWFQNATVTGNIHSDGAGYSTGLTTINGDNLTITGQASASNVSKLVFNLKGQGNQINEQGNSLRINNSIAEINLNPNSKLTTEGQIQTAGGGSAKIFIKGEEANLHIKTNIANDDNGGNSLINISVKSLTLGKDVYSAHSGAIKITLNGGDSTIGGKIEANGRASHDIILNGGTLSVAGNIRGSGSTAFTLNDSATLTLNGTSNPITALTATGNNNTLAITNSGANNTISTLTLGAEAIPEKPAEGDKPAIPAVLAKNGTLTLDTKNALTIGNLTVAGTSGTFIIDQNSTLPTITGATLDGGKILTIDNRKSGQNNLTISNFNVVGDNNIFRLESTATTNAISTLTLGAEATAESDTKNGTLTLENTRALNITTLKVGNNAKGTLNLLENKGDSTINEINLSGGTLTLNNEKAAALSTTLTTSGTSTLNLNKGDLIITTNPVSATSGVSNTFNIGDGKATATLTLEQGFQSNGGGKNKFFIKDSGKLILSNIASPQTLITEDQGSLTHFDISAGANFDFNTYYNALTATNGGTNTIVSAKAITLDSVTANGGTNTITLKGGASNINGDITIDNSNQGKNKFTLEDSASLTLNGATNQITSLDILGTNSNTLTITDGATANSISTLTLGTTTGTSTDGTLNLNTANALSITNLNVAHQSGTLNIDSASQGVVAIGTATLDGKTLTIDNADTTQALAINTLTTSGTNTLNLKKGGVEITEKITAGGGVSNTFNIKSGATLTLTGGFETSGGKNKFVIENQGTLNFGTGSGTSAPLTTAGTGSVTEFDIKSGANFNFGTRYNALEARDGGKNVVTSAVDVNLTGLLASGNSAKNEITLVGNALTLDNISTTSGNNETTNTINVKNLSANTLSASAGKNIITLGAGASTVSRDITEANGGQNLFTLAGTDENNKSTLTLNGADNAITTLDMQANSEFISNGDKTLTIETLTTTNTSTLTFNKGTNTIKGRVENTQATFNVGGTDTASLTFSTEITTTGSVNLQDKATLTLNGGNLKSLNTAGTTITNFAKGTTTITDGISAGAAGVINNIKLGEGATLASAITANGGTNNIALANNSNITGNITATSGTNSITLQGTTGDGTKATINGAMSGAGNSITLDSKAKASDKTNLTLSGADAKIIANLTALSNDASSMNTLTIAENAKGANKIENLNLGNNGTAKGFLTIDNSSGNALTIGTLTSAEAGNILTIGASEVIITNAVANAGLSLKGATLTLNNTNGNSTIASLTTTGTNTINLNKGATTIAGQITATEGIKNNFNIASGAILTLDGGFNTNGGTNAFVISGTLNLGAQLDNGLTTTKGTTSFTIHNGATFDLTGKAITASGTGINIIKSSGTITLGDIKADGNGSKNEITIDSGILTLNGAVASTNGGINSFTIGDGTNQATLTLGTGVETTNGGKTSFTIKSGSTLTLTGGTGSTLKADGAINEFIIENGATVNAGSSAGFYDTIEAIGGGTNKINTSANLNLNTLTANGGTNDITLSGTGNTTTMEITGAISGDDTGANNFTLDSSEANTKTALTLSGASNAISTLTTLGGANKDSNKLTITNNTAGTNTIATLNLGDSGNGTKTGFLTIDNSSDKVLEITNFASQNANNILTIGAGAVEIKNLTGTGENNNITLTGAALTLNGGNLNKLETTTGANTITFAKDTTIRNNGITAGNGVTNTINLNNGVTLTSAIKTEGDGTNTITLTGTNSTISATINGAMSGTGNSITLDSSGTKGDKTNLTLSGADAKTIANLTALSNDASSMNTLTIDSTAKGVNTITNLNLGNSGTAKGFLTIDNSSGNALTIGTLASAEAGNILTIGASEVIITNAVTNAGLSLKGATLTLNNTNGNSTIASLATTGTNTINLKGATTIEGAITAETKNDFNLANSSAIFNGGIGGNGENNFKLDSANGATSLTLKGANNAITTLNALGNQNTLTINTGANGTNKIATLNLGTATGTATNGTLTLNAQKALTIDELNVAHQSGTLGVDVSSREQITISTTTLNGKTLTVNNAGQGQNQKTLAFTTFNATGKDNHLVLGNHQGLTSIGTLKLSSNILQIENNSPNKLLAINAFTGTGNSTLNLTKGGVEITGKITAKNGASNTFDIKSGATLTLTGGFETNGGTNAFIINAGGNLNFGSNDPFKDGLKTDSGTTSFIVKKGANFKFPNDKTIIAGASGINIIDTAETLNLGAITANDTGKNEIALRNTTGTINGDIGGTGANHFTLDSTAGATALTLKGADNAIATLNVLGNQNTLTIGAGANSTNTIKNLVLGDSKAKGLLTIANNATKDNSSNPLAIDTFESKFAESKLSISAGEVKITNALKGENNNITLSDNTALTLNGGKLKSLSTAGTTETTFNSGETTITDGITTGGTNQFNLTGTSGNGTSAVFEGAISRANNFKLDSSGANTKTALTLKGASNAINTFNALGGDNKLTITNNTTGTNKIATLDLGTIAETATDGTLNLNTASALTIDSLNIINKSGTLNIDSASTGKTTIIKTALESKTLTIDNSGSETLEISNFSTKGENTLNLTNTTNTSSTTTIGTLTMENKSKLNISNDSTTNALKITAFKGTGTSTLALTKGKVEITNQVTAGSNTNNIFEISGNLTLAKGFSTSGGTNAFIINAGGNLNFGSNDPFKDGLKTDSGTTSFIVKKGANFKFPNDKTIIAGASGINIIDTAETLNLGAITANDTGKNEIALRNTTGTINGDIGGTGANHFTLNSATLVLKGANNTITTLNLAKETNSVIAFNKDLTIAKLSEMTGSTEKTRLTFINEIKKDEAELDKITYTAGRLVIDGSAINGSKTDDTQSQKLNGTYKMAIRGEKTLPEEIEQTIKVATIKKHNGEGSGSTEDAQANLRSQGVIDLGAESVSVFTRGFTLKKFEYRVSETGADGEKGTGYITYSLGKQMEQDNVEQDILSNIALSATELYLANLNSLNKRMGELRDNNHSQGIWARVFNGQQSNNVNLKSSTNYTTVQVGYDYAFGFNAANNYLGFAFSYSHSQSDFKHKATSGDGAFASIDYLKSDLAEVALYNAYVADSGWYNDTIAKFSYLLNQVGLNTQDQLKSASHKGNVNTYAITLSNEIGYRVKFGGNKEWYIDPQAEVGFGYFEGKELNFSDTQFGVMDTLIILRGRVGTSFGYDFKSVAKEGINAQLYLGVFGEIDYFNGGDVKSEGGTTKWAINDPDIRAVLNVGTNLEVKNSTRIYFDFETSFAGKIKTDYKVNAGVRYSFGENANYKPSNAVKKDAEAEKAPLKIEEKEETKQEVKPAVEQEAQKAQAGSEAKKVEEKEVKTQEQAPKSENVEAKKPAKKKVAKKKVAKKQVAKKQPAKKAEAKVEAKAEAKQPALAQKAEAKPANNAKKQTNRTKKSGGGWGWW